MRRTWLLAGRSFWLVLCGALLLSQSVYALTDEQKKIIDSGIPYFDVRETAACTGTALVGSENAEKIYNFLISQGFQPFQAAGIMGNFQAESGFNPRRVQGTQTPQGDSDTPTPNVGFGIAQWTSRGRQKGLVDLAAANGTVPGDLSTQLQFFMAELNGPYKSVYDALLASTTVEDATDIILTRYEIPADIAGQRVIRVGFARNILIQFGSGTGSTASAGLGCAAASGSCPTEAISVTETVSVHGIQVHPCIAQEVDRIITLANSQGLNMSGGGWRSNDQQITLREKYGCGGSLIYDRSCKGSTPVAVPGSSRHERGTAVDFTCDGAIFRTRTHICFEFLKNNTSLINLPSEPWHWSVDGR